MRALRRDYSRCRGCDRKGDEITLHIHLIELGRCDLDAMLTLCAQCEYLASEMKIQSANIPDFLQQLWRHLHHPEQAVASQAQQVDVTALECMPSQRSFKVVSAKSANIRGTIQNLTITFDSDQPINSK